ncbi:hypothetical protein C8Q80DRAFT_760996 [Daedaleopsis nitida]|nr:hypothetical protein C8Q80DRAFT_760996 [Daedaleopsis nitida]
MNTYIQFQRHPERSRATNQRSSTALLPQRAMWMYQLPRARVHPQMQTRLSDTRQAALGVRARVVVDGGRGPASLASLERLPAHMHRVRYGTLRPSKESTADSVAARPASYAGPHTHAANEGSWHSREHADAARWGTAGIRLSALLGPSTRARGVWCRRASYSWVERAHTAELVRVRPSNGECRRCEPEPLPESPSTTRPTLISMLES